MAEMHKCGQGWAYCDGNCATCATAIPTYTTTSTADNFRWFSRNTNGRPIGGRGSKVGMSGFVTRIEPGKDEPYTVIFTTDDRDKYRHIENECRKMIGHEKPMTNADRIRQMSDEELAEWYWWMLNYVRGATDSRTALLEWLKQEVSE